MPDFHIDGNPGGVRSRAALTLQKGEAFYDTGQALSKITTDGWTGRAAEKWIEAAEAEPQRWTEAGNGFTRAGNALTAYADALEDAQRRADWAEGEYARGEQVTQDARSSYDADVSQARATAQSYLSQGIPYDLTIHPFNDPGAEIRQAALDELASAKADLESAASRAAGEVRAGCRDAPEEPNWFESGYKFVAGVVMGAGEALWDLAKLTAIVPGSPMWIFETTQTLTDLATGDLTPEEWAKQQELKVETALDTLQALQDDPVEFGKNLGKALLDWDTWADDPARALGHLVPDAVAAVLTGGTGAAATRGAKGLTDLAGALGALGRHGDDLAGGAGALGRHGDDLGGLGDLGDLGKLPDGGLTPPKLPDGPDLPRGGPDGPDSPSSPGSPEGPGSGGRPDGPDSPGPGAGGSGRGSGSGDTPSTPSSPEPPSGRGPGGGETPSAPRSPEPPAGRGPDGGDTPRSPEPPSDRGPGGGDRGPDGGERPGDGPGSPQGPDRGPDGDGDRPGDGSPQGPDRGPDGDGDRPGDGSPQGPDRGPDGDPPGDGSTPDGDPPGDGSSPDGDPPGDGSTPDGDPPGDGSTPDGDPPGDGSGGDRDGDGGDRDGDGGDGGDGDGPKRTYELEDGTRHEVSQSPDDIRSQEGVRPADEIMQDSLDQWNAEQRAADPDHVDVTRDDLDRLLNRQVDYLDRSEADLVRQVRDDIQPQRGEIMQRVITPDNVADYARGSSTDPYFSPDGTFGFTSRAVDVVDIPTPQRAFEDLALDYEGSPYRAPGQDDVPLGSPRAQAVDEMHVLRFRTDTPENFGIPRDSATGGADRSWNSDARDPQNPFTGNGWTKGGDPVPEFRTGGTEQLPIGSEIWSINSRGEQFLSMVLKEGPDGPVWVRTVQTA